MILLVLKILSIFLSPPIEKTFCEKSSIFQLLQFFKNIYGSNMVSGIRIIAPAELSSELPPFHLDFLVTLNMFRLSFQLNC